MIDPRFSKDCQRRARARRRRADVPWGVLRSWRWLAVIALGGLLAATPAAIGSLPVGHSTISAAQLLDRIQHSTGTPYSGYAQATGSLGLPVSDQFSSVADLFGGQTQMRVWSRGARNWRVDTISLTGESDVHQDGTNLWTWAYETNQATLTIEPSAPAVRLPVAGDLLPTTLARRLLSEATPSEVSRLPDRRIAGHDVAGLRLRPRDKASTIDEVDVWADPASGLPLAADVRGQGANVVSTRFLDFSPATPSARDTAFTPPQGAHLRTTSDPDIAALIDRLGVATPPARLAGFGRNPQLPSLGSIGVYGRGVTEFAASPLFGHIARSLRRQLSTTTGVTSSAAGQAVTVGPLTLVLTTRLPLVTDPDGDIGTSWLLVGTVTQSTLLAAAAQLTASGR